jgi:hypothetical protein
MTLHPCPLTLGGSIETRASAGAGDDLHVPGSDRELHCGRHICECVASAGQAGRQHTVLILPIPRIHGVPMGYPLGGERSNARDGRERYRAPWSRGTSKDRPGRGRWRRRSVRPAELIAKGGVIQASPDVIREPLARVFPPWVPSSRVGGALGLGKPS